MGGPRVREPWEDGSALGSPSRSWTCGARPAHLPDRRGAEVQARPREVSAGTGSCGCAAAGARISGTRRRLWPRKDSPTPAREPPRPGDDRAREAAGGARAHLRPANGPRVCVHHGGVLPCAPRVPVVPGIFVHHGGVPPCAPPSPWSSGSVCATVGSRSAPLVSSWSTQGSVGSRVPVPLEAPVLPAEVPDPLFLARSRAPPSTCARGGRARTCRRGGGAGPRLP